MTLAELRQLNFRDAGNWPAGVKAGAVAIIVTVFLILGYFFLWSDQFAKLEASQQQEVKLKDTFVQKKQLAINLDAYKQQLQDIEQSFGALLKQLPNKSEMDALLTDINQAGLGRGLQFELFKPAAQETLTEFYAELPVSIKVTGSYHDLGSFASDVAKLPRIVLLQELTIAAGKESVLSMDAVAKTYRYLDEEETARQRKAARDKAKVGK
jgi:type IV pilus assembly protein PilO